MLRQFRPSVCLSVCLSVTRVHGIQTAKHIILSDRPIVLVFRNQGFLRKSDGFTPNGGAEYNGVAIFDQYAAISETETDRGIFSIEDEYKVVCALSNSAAFDELQ